MEGDRPQGATILRGTVTASDNQLIECPSRPSPRNNSAQSRRGVVGCQIDSVVLRIGMKRDTVHLNHNAPPAARGRATFLNPLCSNLKPSNVILAENIIVPIHPGCYAQHEGHLPVVRFALETKFRFHRTGGARNGEGRLCSPR